MTETFQPFPYQIVGRDFLAGRERALLRDKMGLGKTAQAILAAQKIGARRLRVVCNAAAVPVWGRELAKLAPEIDAQVSSYDEFRGLVNRRKPLGDGGPLLVLDEAHYLKNPDSSRTKAVYGPACLGGFAATFERVWALSGTFAPNHAGEYWTHFRALFGEPMGYMDWIKRYTRYRHHPKYGPIITANRPDNLAEINAKIAAVSIGRTIEEAGIDIPPLFWQERLLPQSREIELLARMEADAMADEQYRLWMARTGDADIAALEASPHVAALRRETGRWKAAAVARELAKELDDRQMDKVVVFALHRDVLDQLQSALRDFEPLRVDGSTSKKDRATAERLFQTKPQHRVFLGQIQACGTAITLTAAHHVELVEQSWVPGENLQAVYRCRRIGQARPVIVRVPSVAGTLDDAIDRVLARKARMIDELE